MTEGGGSASLAELLGSLTRDIPELLHKEAQLARAELGEALGLLASAGRQLAAGSVLAAGAVALLLATVVGSLTTILVWRGMGLAPAGCVAAAVTAGVTATLAWWLLSNASRSLRAAKASLDGSLDAITSGASSMLEKL